MSDYLQFSYARDKRRVTAERYSPSGEVTKYDSCEFGAMPRVQKAAKTLGVDPAFLINAVGLFRKDDTKNRVEIPAPSEEKPSAELRVLLRGRCEPDSSAREFTGPDALTTALACSDCSAREPLLKWEGTDQLAALDVDPSSPLPDSEVDRLATLATPRPCHYWRTHHGGLRLMYAATADYAAGDLAIVAGLSIRSQLPTARIEIKSDTRHPAYPLPDGSTAGQVVTQTQTSDVDSLQRLFGEYSYSNPDVENWLQARNLTQSQRYSHDHCPIDPSPESGPDTRPVQVTESGIHCYRCEGKGLSKGSRKAGWFPFSSAVGARIDSGLFACVKNFAHWEHARHVVSNSTNLPDREARHAYSACLKLYHGSKDKRIPAAFVAGRGLVRLDGKWVTEKGESLQTGPSLKPILAALPACHTPEGKVNRADAARLEQPIDLKDYGYPALKSAWSIRLAERFIDDESSPTIIFYPSYLRDDRFANSRPCYREEKDRMPAEKAWQQIEKILPGIDRQVIRCLIAAKGCAESRTGMQPMVFLSGPTGSGKSVSVDLTAGICGDVSTTIPFNPTQDRFRNNIQTALDRGSFLFFDEICKGSREETRRGGSPLDFLLNLTPDSMSYMLRVGGVVLGKAPVTILADTTIPANVAGDGQLGRRIVHLPFTGRKDWEKGIKGLGVQLPHIRTTRGLADACDSILSGVIDDFFRVPHSFQAITTKLGFRLVRDCHTAALDNDALREFAAAVRDAKEDNPPGDGPHCRGWRVIDTRGTLNRIDRAWRAIRDTDDGKDSRKAKSCDWVEIANFYQQAEVEIYQHPEQDKIRVRFVYRNGNAQTYIEELMP